MSRLTTCSLDQIISHRTPQNLQPAPPVATIMTAVSYLTVDTNGTNIFYREAGSRKCPKLLLLHGFPTSSHMFRELIPLLADSFHIVAPDLPGFGNSDPPPLNTFDSIAQVVDDFTQAIGFHNFAIYVFDYGAPIGFRLAVKHPERIDAIISQNGNIYDEGHNAAWDPLRRYWSENTEEHRHALRSLLTPDMISIQYTHGVSKPSRLSPDGCSMDNYYLSLPGRTDIQLDLFGDYKSNIDLYPVFQKYLQKYQPPFLAVWGDCDLFFSSAGAEAFKRDLPHASVTMFETGRFALETHSQEISMAIHQFLSG